MHFIPGTCIAPVPLNINKRGVYFIAPAEISI
jgi:hypothetical protein